MHSGGDTTTQRGGSASRRQIRFGTNATVMTLALIGILILVNILATRNHVRWDLTAEGAFSLSPESIQIIQNLGQPVQITGFYNADMQGIQEELESRLQEYTARSDLISYRFVDPDVEPALANNYDITSYGTIVFESGGRRHQISQTDEQSLTSALLKVTQETVPTVYFLTGHRERSIEDFEQTGYSEAQRILEQDNYRVQPISLIVSDTIPLQNTVLVVADPQTPFQPREEAVIGDYLAMGGRMMLLSDPFNPAPLSRVMQSVRLGWNNDLLFDEQSELGRPFNPVVSEYPFHPITDGINDLTLFSTVRTITQTAATPRMTRTPLLTSSPNSQAATDFSGGQVQFAPGDPMGPLNFGYSIEGVITATLSTTRTAVTDRPARLVVIGDADFASNALITLPGTANRDFFRSAVAWLAAQESEFTLPPREDPVDRTLFLTAGQSNLVFYSSTFGLPLLVIIVGVVVWWRRR